MFNVKVKLHDSKIHGIGLFTDQDIKKGNLIYTQNTSKDLILTSQDLLKLSKEKQEEIRHYGYFDKYDGKWHLAFDDIKYCNHSKDPNMILKKERLVAKKDIKKDEELTQDYAEFEELRESLR